MNDSGNLKYANLWIRWLAIILDSFIFIAINFVLKTAFYPDYKVEYYWFYLLICVLYYILMDSSKYQGSVGKIILNLKVIDLNGARISIPKSAVRYIIEVFPKTPLIICSAQFTAHPELMDMWKKYIVKNFAGADPQLHEFIIQYLGSYLVAIVLGLIWCLPILFTKQRTGVHDLLSKTRVIRVNSGS